MSDLHTVVAVVISTTDADWQARARYEEVEGLGDHEGQSRTVPANDALDPGLEESSLKGAPLGRSQIRGEQ